MAMIFNARAEAYRIWLLAFALHFAGSALALDAPKGPVVLTVSGKIADTNKGAVAEIDMAMLKALPQHTFTTDTPWDKRPVKFSGPLLRDVLAMVKASGAELKAVAVNDYAVSVPAADAQQFNVVLAVLMNDRDIPPRTKGPLFLIYPFNSNPSLNAKVYQDRSIWQLKALQVQ
jgi:hypothetical protein